MEIFEKGWAQCATVIERQSISAFLCNSPHLQNFCWTARVYILYSIKESSDRVQSKWTNEGEGGVAQLTAIFNNIYLVNCQHIGGGEGVKVAQIAIAHVSNKTNSRDEKQAALCILKVLERKKTKQQWSDVSWFLLLSTVTRLDHI